MQSRRFLDRENPIHFLCDGVDLGACRLRIYLTSPIPAFAFVSLCGITKAC